MPAQSFKIRSETFEKAGIKLLPAGSNIVDEVWAENKPAMPSCPAYVLDDKYTGQSTKSKLETVASKLIDNDMYLLTALDDIAWLMNMRGSDIEFNPLFFSFAILHKDCKADLFIDSKKIQEASVQEYLKQNGISVFGYDQIEPKLKEYNAAEGSKKKIVVDESQCNYKLYKCLIDSKYEIVKKSSIVE